MYGKSILKFGVIWVIIMVILIGVTGMQQKHTQELAQQCTAETEYEVSDVDTKTETKRVKRNGKYRTETETKYVVTFDYEVDDTLFHTTKTYSSNEHSIGEVGKIYYLCVLRRNGELQQVSYKNQITFWWSYVCDIYHNDGC